MRKMRIPLPLLGTRGPDSHNLHGCSSPLVPVQDLQCSFKLESRNPTGSVHDRGVSAILSSADGFGKDLVDISVCPWLALSFAAGAARAGIRLNVHLTEPASAGVLAEFALYGANMRGHAPLDGLPGYEAMRRAGLAGLAHELLTEIPATQELLIVLPSDEEILQSVLKEAFAAANKPVRLLCVNWRASRTQAFQRACELARNYGLLLGLPSAAAINEVASLRAAGKLETGVTVVILDCYAPKFFAEFGQPPAGSPEESKLGGLITPR